ncbi:Na(+)/H(+) antiporter subunit C [Rhodococcus oxybenzonivorans]|jgi:multicomponent Na+:H+ antiporter subunit C|uniref:Na(+)/H(+) antiporter subunit C n=1 Tax=Rhodococcus TaxID=1827 RepID=UPI0013202078|nr:MULTISPECIES: Na(+)/H(+) antiporter subunit C [Rhodococcus]MDV7357319.1 Na(+)/H(+) antiporter subunit C [Rhodococcus oxybenzonivorans]QHE68067.1 Na(+) H(+) antiporter subunit C [Rhodococcus sp. WAY2]
MSANIGFLVIIGVLVSAGVYLLIERSITRMLLGLLLFGNGINLLILTSGGSDGNPPIVGRDSIHESMADPLAQAMVLTAIVITMGIAAFVLALAYRSFKITTADLVENDPEDTRVLLRRSPSEAPDRDRSDDPVTGEPSFTGDAFDRNGNPIPLEALRNLEDLEGYEELHTGDFDDDEDDKATIGKKP